jgi:hypothetical protein
MAGIGVLLALIFTFFLMPALVAAIDKVFPWQKRDTDLESDAPPAPSSTRGMGLAVVILVLSFGFTGFSVWKAGSVSFEYDFTKLDAPKKPSPQPEGPPKKDYKDAVGRATTRGPAVALCDTSEHCAEMTRTLAAVKAVTLTDANGDRVIDPDILMRLEAVEQGKPLPPPKVPESAPVEADEDEEDDEDDPFAKRKKADPFEALEKELAASPVSPDQWELLKRLGSLRSSEIVYFLDAYLALYTFVPTDQERKLQIIADVRKRVDAKKSLLKDESKKKVDDFRRYLDVNKPIEVADLPVWVTEQLVDTEGHLGRFIIMWNRGAKADYRDSKRLHDAYFDFPVTGGSVGVAANFFVLVDVIDTLRKDGPVVLSAAVIAVFVCLLFFFRSLTAAFITMLPLAMAITWLAGLHYLYEWKVNMYSIIAFPLLIGMSIDQGVHVYHRWRESPNLRVVMRETGGANVLTTITTVIGFGGLWFAENLGIRSLGTTASVGTVLGLIGSCATLPALLFVIDRLKRRT